MKVAFISLVIFLSLFQPLSTEAKSQHHRSSSPDDSGLIEHGSYVNSDGNTVHSPAHTKNGGVPDGATALCRDGSYSFSQHHSGTCSHHGGVEGWL